MRYLTALATWAGLSVFASPVFATQGETITVTGEIIDTWCYMSGVMGPPEATQGSAHHACALWCSAGGIPVGLVTEDGTVYMVLKIEGDAQLAGGDTALRLAAHTVEATGVLHARDGLNYLIVESVLNDYDIQNENHEEWGNVPGFSIPDPNK